MNPWLRELVCPAYATCEEKVKASADRGKTDAEPGEISYRWYPTVATSNSKTAAARKMIPSNVSTSRTPRAKKRSRRVTAPRGPHIFVSIRWPIR